jgi:hypothetical protein
LDSFALALRLRHAEDFEKILCPIAFDRNSSAAIKFAHELADARLTPRGTSRLPEI